MEGRALSWPSVNNIFYCLIVELKTLRLGGGPHSRSQAGKWQHGDSNPGGLGSQAFSTLGLLGSLVGEGAAVWMQA